MRLKKECCFYFNSKNQNEQNSTFINFPKNEGAISDDHNNSNDKNINTNIKHELFNKDNNMLRSQVGEKMIIKQKIVTIIIMIIIMMNWTLITKIKKVIPLKKII